MPQYLDVETWSRRDLFHFFIGYANPYFNVCTQLDVTNLVTLVRSRSDVRMAPSLHYFALRVANGIEPFRYRLKDGRVLIYEIITGGTTVLLPNESFAYAYFDYTPNFEKFVTDCAKSINDVRTGSGELKPTMRDDVIYFTSLPWISFTSFAHARGSGRGESIPRFVFGKFTEQNGRLMLPMSVEVHHALVDGVHVGRFFNNLQEAFTDPEHFIRKREPEPAVDLITPQHH